ncbi:MAG TPA: hypothetical protein VMT30_03285 [Candidatus Saccharimonadia bacterium]|nr:hypothetical protein [Candidatus Saccharimonadia bacterium]
MSTGTQQKSRGRSASIARILAVAVLAILGLIKGRAMPDTSSDSDVVYRIQGAWIHAGTEEPNEIKVLINGEPPPPSLGVPPGYTSKDDHALLSALISVPPGTVLEVIVTARSNPRSNEPLEQLCSITRPGEVQRPSSGHANIGDYVKHIVRDDQGPLMCTRVV